MPCFVVVTIVGFATASSSSVYLACKRQVWDCFFFLILDQVFLLHSGFYFEAEAALTKIGVFVRP